MGKGNFTDMDKLMEDLGLMHAFSLHDTVDVYTRVDPGKNGKHKVSFMYYVLLSIHDEPMDILVNTPMDYLELCRFIHPFVSIMCKADTAYNLDEILKTLRPRR